MWQIISWDLNRKEFHFLWQHRELRILPKNIPLSPTFPHPLEKEEHKNPSSLFTKSCLGYRSTCPWARLQCLWVATASGEKEGEKSLLSVTMLPIPEEQSKHSAKRTHGKCPHVEECYQMDRCPNKTIWDWAQQIDIWSWMPAGEPTVSEIPTMGQGKAEQLETELLNSIEFHLMPCSHPGQCRKWAGPEVWKGTTYIWTKGGSACGEVEIVRARSFCL